MTHTVEVLSDTLGRFFALCSCNWTSGNHLRHTQAADDGEAHQLAMERWESDDDLADREPDGRYSEQGTCWKCCAACRGTVCASCLRDLNAEQDRQDRDYPQTRSQPRMAGY
jgi:hypothetical protein